MTQKITNRIPTSVTIHTIFSEVLSKFKAVTITKKAQLSATTAGDIKKGDIEVTGGTLMKLTTSLLPNYYFDVIAVPKNDENDEVIAKEIELFDAILDNWKERYKLEIWNNMIETEGGKIELPPTYLDSKIVELNASMMVTESNDIKELDDFTLDLDFDDDLKFD